ncbi:MAG: hypothetical protein ACOZQL_11820 [Myxococcota bacterium]
MKIDNQSQVCGGESSHEPVCRPPPPPSANASTETTTVEAWRPADGACANAPTGQSRQPADLTCMIGDVGYYRARYDDFVQRHPGQKPPSYYLEYGEKYAQRFTRETAAKLSPDGQKWLQRTFELLQSRMEHLRMTDLAAFEKLERDPEAFKKFAYETHSDSYLDAGLSKLPASDLAIIGFTPDASDLLTPDGLKQGVVTGAAVVRDKVQEALQ